MATTKNLLPGEGTYTVGNSSKPWGAGYFNKIYDNTGDEYVHAAEVKKYELYIDEDGDVCQKD